MSINRDRREEGWLKRLISVGNYNFIIKKIIELTLIINLKKFLVLISEKKLIFIFFAGKINVVNILKKTKI